MKKRFAYNGSLPESLKKELRMKNVTDGKRAANLLAVLKEGGGNLNVNELLIGWYKMFGEVMTRTQIVSIAYRLVIAGHIYKTGRKGEYSLQKEATEKGE